MIKKKIKTNRKSVTIFALMIVCSHIIAATDPTSLPLVQIEQLEYQGAFIIPSAVYGESRADNVTGHMEYSSANHSLFFAGKFTEGAIAEFAIPALVNSADVTTLNTATVLQSFREILDQTPDTNPQNLNRVTGIKLFEGKLIINAVDFYDAGADNTHTTLVLEDAADIANSAISGYYELQGEAHIAGWMSDVPDQWQSLLGGAYLAGNAPNYSINSRYPQGPTAFIFDPATLAGSPSGEIATTVLMDTSLTNPLYADYTGYQRAQYNVLSTNGASGGTGHTAADLEVVAGTNDLWTEMSNVGFGFIIPNSRTYLTIGESGGHNLGIGYKARPNGSPPGYNCAGPCSYDPNDYYNYYWLWDINDLIAVKNGSLQPYEIRPYDYGVFNAPFQANIYSGTPRHNPIIGGTYDSVSGLLYLTIGGGESTGQYGFKPLVVAYKINNSDLVFANGFDVQTQ